MKHWIIVALLLLGCTAAHAQKQQAFSPDEQQAMLEQLERGERVDLSTIGTATTASQSKAEGKATTKQTTRCMTITALYNRYADEEGFSSVIYGKRMMEMMAERVRSEDKELAKLLEGIRSIHVISTKAEHPDFEADTRSWIDTAFDEEQELSHVVERGQTTDSYLIDGGRYNQSTFVLVSFGVQEQVVLRITGYFSVKDISRLSSIRP